MRLFTVRESAERLGIKPKTVRFWIWTRKIEYVKIGRAVRLREDTIQKLIERGTVPEKRT
jgi:excisionase family DNA binding protein